MSGIVQHTQLVLASGSAIRQQMLKGVGLAFSVVPSACNEDLIKDEMADSAPFEIGQALARAKAQAVAPQYPNALTIAADQICELEGEIFDKPGSIEQAEANLARLSGQTHVQHSAVCLMREDEILWEYVDEAYLTMRELSPDDIKAYVELDRPLASCGAYKLEAHGRYLFADIQGDYDVIRGLPLVPLLHCLQQLGAVKLEVS